MIGTTHLNKATGGTYRQRVAGSGGYLAVARVGLLVHRHPDNPDLRVLALGKGNLGQVPDSIVFEIEGVDVVNPDDPNEVADVGVLANPYADGSLTVDEVLAGVEARPGVAQGGRDRVPARTFSPMAASQPTEVFEHGCRGGAEQGRAQAPQARGRSARASGTGTCGGGSSRGDDDDLTRRPTAAADPALPGMPGRPTVRGPDARSPVPVARVGATAPTDPSGYRDPETGRESEGRSHGCCASSATRAVGADAGRARAPARDRCRRPGPVGGARARRRPRPPTGGPGARRMGGGATAMTELPLHRAVDCCELCGRVAELS